MIGAFGATAVTRLSMEVSRYSSEKYISPESTRGALSPFTKIGSPDKQETFSLRFFFAHLQNLIFKVLS